MYKEKTLPLPLVILAGSLVCILFTFIIFFVEESPPTVLDSTQNQKHNVENSPIPYISQTLAIMDTTVDTFWHDTNNPNGILFLFHGCSHSGEDWFSLPEEVKLVKQAIKLNLVPVAFTSKDRSSKCWDHNPPNQFPDIYRRNKDLAPVSDVILYLIEENNWGHLPLSLLGTSSGSLFASMIPQHLDNIEFHSLLLYILPNQPKNFNTIAPQKHAVIPFPKVGFLGMKQDEQSGKIIQQTRALLEEKGVKTQLWTTDKIKLHPYFFSDEIPISKFESEELYNLLLDNGYLNNKNYLLRNPRSSKWKELFSENFSRPVLLEEYSEHLTELMNAAFAFHEMSASYASEILQWAVE